MSFSNVSKQVVLSFCVAGVALCDIPTCLITRGKCQKCRARSGSTGSGEGPGQVQQGSEKGTGRLWCRARSGSIGFRRRFRRRSGGFGEGSGEGLGGFGAEPGQVQ